VFMANGLLDLDLSGGVLIRIGRNGSSNNLCVGAICRREEHFTGIIITSLKDCSFKEIGRKKFLLCQGNNVLI